MSVDDLPYRKYLHEPEFWRQMFTPAARAICSSALYALALYY